MKKSTGITLIALIITIIVMLILVAVTINMAVNGGLFGYAGNAARDTKTAIQDEGKIDKGRIVIDNEIYTSIDKFIEPETFSEIYEETSEYVENGVTTAWIPKGFAVGTSEGINKVANGLVIKDDLGNEFVWIPISATTTSEFDYIRTTKTDRYYAEPTSSSQTEYEAMRASAISKKGFYIARYEAGCSSARASSIVSLTTPISKKGVYPYNNVTWGNAKTSSTNMYNNTAKYEVKSTLCYGVQWDAMLSFLGKTEETSSSDWGNYRDAGPFEFEGEYYTVDSNTWKNDKTLKDSGESMLLQTGASDRNSLKNIYDVAGNVEEWTMEVISSSNRVFRGSYFRGNSWCGHRNNSGTGLYDIGLGFRMALYIPLN